MRANPIEEIKELRVRSHHLENVEFTDSTPAILPLKSNTFDLTLEFEPGDTEQVILNIPGAHIRYKTKEQIIEHREIPLKLIDGKVKIRVLVDVCLYARFFTVGVALFLLTSLRRVGKLAMFAVPRWNLRLTGSRSTQWLRVGFQ